MRGPGFKGLPADQRISGLRSALELLREAQITIRAVHQAEEEILERIPGRNGGRRGDDLQTMQPHLFRQ
jgi:hypothetical protein